MSESLKFPRIYIGPSSSSSYLRTNAVYADGYPKVLLALLERHPEIKQLIVPVAEMSAAKKEIAHKGTLLHATFFKVIEILKQEQANG